ncbi:MAG: LPS assembly lipoprotein LptE [Methylophilaceae bacterium]|nr:LPS assembly lipoprotein LptE [Methylophilaceae bacterium]
MKLNMPLPWAAVRHWLLAGTLLTLTACGFHLRDMGSDAMPFQSLYLLDSGAPTIAQELRRSFRSGGVRLVSAPEDADVALELMREHSAKNILSLSGRGKVREYELIYRVEFRTRPASSPTWSHPQTVELRRDFSYSDSALLAKDYEETRLLKDMYADAIREIMRRVSRMSREATAATP